jgi:hypothetical protein
MNFSRNFFKTFINSKDPEQGGHLLTDPLDTNPKTLTLIPQVGPCLTGPIVRGSVADPDLRSGAFFTPGSGMGKKTRSGSGGMNIPDHIKTN